MLWEHMQENYIDRNVGCGLRSSLACTTPLDGEFYSQDRCDLRFLTALSILISMMHSLAGIDSRGMPQVSLFGHPLPSRLCEHARLDQGYMAAFSLESQVTPVVFPIARSSSQRSYQSSTSQLGSILWVTLRVSLYSDNMMTC